MRAWNPARRPLRRPLRGRRNCFAPSTLEGLEVRLVLSGSAPLAALASYVSQPDTVESPLPAGYSPSSTPDAQGVASPDGVLTPYEYTPQQIRTAYGISSINFGGTVGNGAGQTIAIITAYDDPALVDSTASNFSSSDLAEFDKAFGLPNPPSFTKYNESGQTTNLPGTDPAGPGTNNWEAEEALDAEWTHAVAPGASIDLIECNANDDTDLYTGVQTAASLPGVSVVVMGFTAPEWSGETAYDSVFTTPSGHQGVTFVSGTGDNGAPAGYPATSPNVVAVGGTTLYLNSNNSYNDETGWSVGSDPFDPSLGGAGGNSAYETTPAYQYAVSTTSSLPFDGARATPDVSMDGDPVTGIDVYDSYNNGTAAPWIGTGGTSVSTPLFAGLIAIANQGRVLQGGTTLNSSTDPTQTLSALYSLPPTDFHDITVGYNGYSAMPGYDEVTGLGSPVANLLVPDLAAYDMASRLTVTAQPPSRVAAGQSFEFQVSAEDSFGQEDHGFSGYVTASIAGDPEGGSDIASADNGTATLTFSAGSPGFVQLAATSSGLTATTSNTINVSGSTPLGYVPQQILTAYGINDISFNGAKGSGAGQTIAIITLYDDPDIASDLSAFDRAFGLPNPPSFNKYTQSGWTPAADPTGNWEAQEALAVEWAHAIAPGASIDVFELNPADTALEAYQQVQVAADLPGVSVVSMAFGSINPSTGLTGETSGETSYDQYFTTPSGHQGVTFVAPTGDYAGYVGYPASSPNVVAVGGTSLFLNPDNSYDSEIGLGYVTSQGGEVGSGGGISLYEPEPSYQDGVQSTGQRAIPDVSFDADPLTGVALYDSYGNPSSPWTVLGGTNLAASAWAGLIAIANQGRVAEGGSTLNSSTDPQQTQTALYSLPYSDYHDVATGSNAGYGYDLATGLGTPIANELVPDLAAYGMATRLAVTQQPPTTIISGTNYTIIVTAEDANGHVDSSYDGSVTMTFASNGGQTTVTAVNGVARFDYESAFVTGTGYTDPATASGLTSATSHPFSVVPGAATQLVIAVEPPSSVAAHSPFGLTVDAEDRYGNLATSFDGSVTVALDDNPGGSSLRGQLTVTADDGVATFSHLILNNPGIGYTLEVFAGTLTPATTITFDVTAPGGSGGDEITEGSANVTAGDVFGLTVTDDTPSADRRKGQWPPAGFGS
jgi:subtilase family serine protease